MMLFANIIDVLIPENQTSVGNLDFSLLSVCKNSNFSGLDFDVSIGFGNYRDKEKSKIAIKASKPWDKVCRSKPILETQEMAINFLLDRTAQVHGDRKSLVIIISHGDAVASGLNRSMAADILNHKSITIFTIILMEEDGQHFVDADLDKRLAGPVFLTNSQEIATDQAIPLVICRKCYAGWFYGSYPHQGHVMSRSSCYTLIPDLHMNWMDANLKCANLPGKSSLVTVETVQERVMLREKLTRWFREQSYNNVTLPYTLYVFVGLMRDSHAVGNKFMWINENPLVENHWAQGEPFGRWTRRCAFWNLTQLATDASATREGLDTMAGQYDEELLMQKLAGSEAIHRTYSTAGRPQFSDSWSSIGCGETVSGLAMCEVQAPVVIKREYSVSSFVSSRSRESAIRRGEVAFGFSRKSHLHRNSLFSASAPELYDTSINLTFSVYQGGEYQIAISLTEIPRYQCTEGSSSSISYSYVCEVDFDCPQREDESFCNTDKALYKCTTGHVIPQYGVCDLFPDCPRDQSDENRLCARCVHLLCATGECLPSHWFMDLEPDCRECSSYQDVGTEIEIARAHNVTDCVFMCNRTDCVSRWMLGDKIVHCTGPEGPLDESVGSLESIVCYENQHPRYPTASNWGPRCIFVLDVYGELIGCRNMKHLSNCTHFTCPEGYVKCPRSYCIPVHYVNNGRADCALNEDEVSMKLDCSGLFRCSRSEMWLHPDRICDNHRDCPKGDDELNCHVSCRGGFLCLAGTVSVKGLALSTQVNDLGFVDERTRRLDVSKINVSAALYHFTCRPRPYLNHLNVSRCSLKSEHITVCQKRVFQFLEVLDLSHNLLDDSFQPKNIIRHSYNVLYLNLSHNIALKTFNVDKTFSRLKHLDLSYTGISTFALPSQGKLRSLSVLKLRGTKILSILPWFFPRVYSIMHLDLQEIPIKEFTPMSFGHVSIGHLYTNTYKLCCPRLYNTKRPLGQCHAPEDPFSSCSDLMSGTALRAVVWTVGALALFGNLVVCVNRCFLDRSSLRMAYGHFVAHLSLSDFLMGVYLLIIASADTRLRGIYFLRDTEWRNSLACKLAGFLSTVSSETSMFFILLITLDRFLVVKFPLGQIRLSGRYVHALCALAWVLGLTIALMPLLPPFRHWHTYTCNGVCLGLPLGDGSLPGFQFSVAIFIFLNFGLFLLIAAGQLVIYRVIANTRSKVTRKTNSPASRRAQDIKVTKRLFLVAASDFMCWFPVGIMGILSLTGHCLGYTAYAWSAVLVLPVNSAINPMIYNVSTLLDKCGELIKRQKWWAKSRKSKITLGKGKKHDESRT
ncbi:G-protein coupled receptor GRL101-like [Aplysia californica]|uniref:G-protein coupled receptor GRL101-like n=1 Tax=Aplysia californica TaxID=6500 RepID=A0ABM0JPU4_APLCA|nr:G-protein coupled receptor GRL101-like [Aplysia californica]